MLSKICSPEAHEVLETYKNATGFYEFISIDGCDALGPKAYIYTLFVLWKDEYNEIFVDNWDWEKRYWEGEAQNYLEENYKRTYSLEEYEDMHWTRDLSEFNKYPF